MFVPGEIEQKAHNYSCRETSERRRLPVENQVERTDVKCADADKRKQGIKRLQRKGRLPLKARLAPQHSLVYR